MRIDVCLYGHLRNECNRTQPIQLEVEPGTTGRELFRRLDINENEVVLIAVNGKTRDLDEELKPEDQVAIFPPVDGG